MGKRTVEADLTLTHAIAENDRLRALKGRQRIDAIERLKASDEQLKLLTEARESAVKADGDDATAGHAERLKAATNDVATSRAAEKLAASIDADVDAVVAKIGKLTAMVQPRYETAKQATLEAHGIPALIHRIETNRRWVATAVGQDREAAAAEQADLNREYTWWLSDLSSLLSPLGAIRHTSPLASEAIADVFMLIRAAFTGEVPPRARKTLAAAHATATAALENHVEMITQKAPKS